MSDRLAAESQNKEQVQQSRIEGLEQSIERLNARLGTLRADVERLSSSTVEAEIPPLEAMLETQQEQTERIETELGDVTSKIEHQREETSVSPKAWMRSVLSYKTCAVATHRWKRCNRPRSGSKTMP